MACPLLTQTHPFVCSGQTELKAVARGLGVGQSGTKQQLRARIYWRATGVLFLVVLFRCVYVCDTLKNTDLS